MKHVKKSVLLGHSPHQMYLLVTAVEDYPKFLPWCERAEVLERRDGSVTARLHLSYLGVRQSFTTQNLQVEDQRVDLKLVDGPFSELDGTWRFIPVPPAEGRGGGAEADACRIEFELRYTFANFMLEALISPMFDRIADTFVDSFVRRAEQVYGNG